MCALKETWQQDIVPYNQSLRTHTHTHTHTLTTLNFLRQKLDFPAECLSGPAVSCYFPFLSLFVVLLITAVVEVFLGNISDQPDKK